LKKDWEARGRSDERLREEIMRLLDQIRQCCTTRKEAMSSCHTSCREKVWYLLVY
jgi:hypothetical protein